MEYDILVMHTRSRYPKMLRKVERFNGTYNAERSKHHVPAEKKEEIRCRLA